MFTINTESVIKRLCDYVGQVQRDDFIVECVQQASHLVSNYATNSAAPVEILDRAALEVAAELYHRRGAPNGIKQFADGFDGATAIRVARDPMVAARPLLDPYMPIPF